MERADDIHAATRELLPWYLNRTLGAAEHTEVERHLRECLTCRRDMKSLAGIADALTRPTGDIGASASFAALRTRMTGTAIPIPERKAAAVPLHRKPLVRLAFAASLLLALVPAGIDTLRENMGDAPYYTLATPPAAAVPHTDLRVVFAPGTSASIIAEVMAGIGGTVTGEQNSAGALAVRLSGGRSAQERALATLRARSDILLAEPVESP